jgi:GrpB-like predicted nucleotidyltransferase (UPF0157 family)
MELVSERELRDRVLRAMERNFAVIERLLASTTIEHIGATAVPGSLTKGDLDLLVAVPAADFGDAKHRLAERYAPHYPEEWEAERASFAEVPEADLPVGVQLVVAGGEDERVFLAWRDRLRSEPELLERYNELKSRHGGDDYDAYTAAKARFIEAAVAP